jgi:cytochrome P450
MDTTSTSATSATSATTETTPAAAARPRDIRELPAPRGWPIVGHAFVLDPPRAYAQMAQWARELGSPYRLEILGRRIVVWDDPEVAQAALRERPVRFTRNRNLRPVFQELGIDGLFSTEGQAWAPQRRLIMQSLNASHFRGFWPTLHAITQRLLARWQAAAARGETIEMTQELVRYTVDVSSALAFGEDPNTIEQEGDQRIQQHLALLFPAVMKRVMAPFPIWRHVKTAKDRALDRAVAAIHAYAHERIAVARRRLADDPLPEGTPPRSALEAMLLPSAEDDTKFSDDVIVANVLTLLLAGEDTTAHTLAWAIWLIAQHAEARGRLVAAADTALGGAAMCATHEGLKALDLFEHAGLEALRLKPVAPLLGVSTTAPEDVVGGVKVDASVRLFFLNRVSMLDPRWFGRPSEFVPERWGRERPPGCETHEVRAFMQFGTGPRVCPGRHLANVEIRLVLSMLLRNFEVELACPASEVKEVSAFTLMPDKLPVRLLPRA